MTPSDRRRMATLLEAATKLPWRWRFQAIEQLSDAGKGYPIDYYPDCATIQGSRCDECGNRVGPSDADGEFIVAAANAVPALIAEVAQLREALVEALDWATKFDGRHAGGVMSSEMLLTAARRTVYCRRAEVDGSLTPEQVARGRRATRTAMQLAAVGQRRPLRAAEQRRPAAARADLVANRAVLAAKLAEIEAGLAIPEEKT